ncbi:GerMN domain-containing protein [Halalkalibacter lacteus]|uniref:GerMN domain-containing protein n=1 Tax=Halalkalibacter lacteus TaxID=3090663 RepID=UPI002FCB1817
MKKHWMFLLLGLSILLLGACGQGTTSNEQEEQPADGIESEENSDLVEEETEVDTDEEVEPEVDSETVETETEAEDTPTNEEGSSETTSSIELVFSDDQVIDMYRVERQLEITEDALFVATLEAWVQGPTEEGLISIIPSDVEVQSVEDKEGVAHVSFSSELLNAQVGSGTEYMLVQQIAMAMQQFGFDETQILIDGEVHSELFGHIDTSQPIVAEDISDYEKVE